MCFCKLFHKKATKKEVSSPISQPKVVGVEQIKFINQYDAYLPLKSFCDIFDVPYTRANEICNIPCMYVVSNDNDLCLSESMIGSSDKALNFESIIKLYNILSINNTQTLSKVEQAYHLARRNGSMEM